jgi:signal transduction histidine kinase
MKFNLKQKIIFYFLISSLIIIGLYGSVTYLMIVSDLNKEMENRLNIAGGLILKFINSDDISSLKLKGEIYNEYIKKFEDLKRVAQLNNILIIDNNQNVILSMLPEGEEFYIHLDNNEIKEALNGRIASSILYKGAKDKYYKTTYIPIKQNYFVLGVEASVVYLEYIKHYKTSLFIAGVTILIFSVLIALFISSRVTSSIKILKRKAEEIAKRNFNEEIKINAEEEINTLATTLDEMKNELQEYILNRERMATVGEFSAGIAHEIRNSLNVISGYAELVKNKITDEEALKKINDILRNIMKMNDFLNNFLNYTKQYSPEKQKQDIKKIINEIIEEVPEDIKNCIIKKYDNEILQVFVDEFLIKQAIQNIVLNAYQALDKKEKIIEIDCYKELNKVAIAIKDNGKGFDDDIKDKIFQPFWTNKKYGVGLGLAISYRIIKELHNGEIVVKSKKGVGSLFKIYL